MKKHFLIALTAAALILPGLSSGAFAAHREKTDEQHMLSAEHIAALTDARIAALKVGLKLTSAQDKNWPSLETTLRDVAKARAARAAEWHEKAKEVRERRDVLEGLRLREKSLSARSAELGKIADAAKPLYDSLDDAQKHRFGVLLQDVFKPHDHHWRWGLKSDEPSDEHDDSEHQE
jgi:hypothetical protein